MKANTVRLGNWVYDAKGQPNRVDMDALKYLLDYGDTPMCQVKPIPISEDILLKLEFTKMDGEWYLYPCFEIQIIVYNEWNYGGVMFYTRTIHTDFTPIYCCENIKHLHQLQNLYYALTGEELTIDL